MERLQGNAIILAGWLSIRVLNRFLRFQFCFCFSFLFLLLRSCLPLFPCFQCCFYSLVLWLWWLWGASFYYRVCLGAFCSLWGYWFGVVVGALCCVLCWLLIVWGKSFIFYYAVNQLVIYSLKRYIYFCLECCLL